MLLGQTTACTSRFSKASKGTRDAPTWQTRCKVEELVLLEATSAHQLKRSTSWWSILWVAHRILYVKVSNTKFISNTSNRVNSIAMIHNAGPFFRGHGCLWPMPRCHIPPVWQIPPLHWRSRPGSGTRFNLQMADVLRMTSYFRNASD